MTKSKNSIINRSITYVTTFPAVVTESTFCLLPLGRFLLPLSIMNKHILSGSSSHFLLTTSFWNVSIAIHWMFLATIPFLDFVMIHWIQQKVFWRISIVFCGKDPLKKSPMKSKSFDMGWIKIKVLPCLLSFISAFRGQKRKI